MSWVGVETAHIYLGSDRGGLQQVGHDVQWLAYASIAEGARQLMASALEKLPRRRLRKPSVKVWLSGALAQPFVCGPVQGLKRWTEVASLAQATAASETQVEGTVAVEVERWPWPIATLGVAVSEHVVDVVHAAASAHGVHLASFRPWWAVAARVGNASTRGAQIVAVEDTEATVLLAEDKGAFETAISYHPKPSLDELASIVRRRAMFSEAATLAMRRMRVDNVPAGGAVPFGVDLIGIA